MLVPATSHRSSVQLAVISGEEVLLYVFQKLYSVLLWGVATLAYNVPNALAGYDMTHDGHDTQYVAPEIR